MNVYSVSMIVYFIIAFAIAIIYSRKRTTSNEDFFLGGRQFGIVFVFFTMMATFLGAGTTVGTTAWIWKRGLSQVWMTAGYAVVFLFIGLFLAARVRRFGTYCNAYTFADFLEMRYNKSARYIGATLMWFAFMSIAAFQYMGIGRIINTVTGIDYNIAVLIAALITILYTSYGGMWAIAITGVVKGALVFIGILIMAPVLYMKAGGMEGIASAVPVQHFSLVGYISPGQALTWFLVFFLGIIPMQDWWQRVLAAKGEREARLGLMYLVAGFVFIETLIYMIGFAGKVLEPNIANPESLFPTLVIHHFSPYIGGLLLAALVAIITSTASACLLVASTHFTRDLYNGIIKPNATDAELLKFSKISTLGLGVLVLVFVFAAPGMFELFVISADILGASLTVPILAGFFVPRVGEKAGFYAMLAGIIGWAVSYMGWHPMGFGPAAVGGLFSLIAVIIGMMVLPPADRAVLEKMGLMKPDETVNVIKG
ncbi:sodium:solute symporter family protein [Sporomusa sphaeroides]|uniref:sodium:solute symporter family protein n=1 Tax=Sporomusa sphaeroides TaxID=47679 RepID=UPI003158ACE5